MAKQTSSIYNKILYCSPFILAICIFILIFYSIFLDSSINISMTHVWLIAIIIVLLLTYRYSEINIPQLGIVLRRSVETQQAIISTTSEISEDGTKAPLLNYQFSQKLIQGGKRKFPDLGFILQSLDEYNVYILRIFVRLYLGGKDLGMPEKANYYNGNKTWTLNPRQIIWGHFFAPIEMINSEERFEVKVRVEVLKPFEYTFGEVGWVYQRKYNRWYFEP